MGSAVESPVERELTREEVAAILRRHPKTVSKLIHNNLLQARREGPHYRISETNLNNYIASTYQRSA